MDDGIGAVLPSVWQLAPAAPGSSLDALDEADWIDAPVPGTVAQALQAAGRWRRDDGQDLDDRDWWYRCAFDRPSGKASFLRFRGLATLASVWLNGELVLRSENMFEEHRVEVGDRWRARNEIVICFHSLNAAMQERRPRPRWKTRLVANQQLRWFRTTLLGRIPGWSPSPQTVGPWRPIAIDDDRPEISVRAYLDGDCGVLECIASPAIDATVTIAGVSVPMRGRAVARVENAALWWPHTHGEPHLYDCEIAWSGGREVRRVGFRRVEVKRDGGDFEVRINDVPIFCRGASWTVEDSVTLAGDPARTLGAMREAGANMIRVGGTMVYEDDAFYRLCDELGILVWQDFMFASMDYPADDAAFAAAVRREATQQLSRLREHPSVVIHCGNSEVEQQAAMLGMAPEIWRSPLFGELLPQLCAELSPATAYVPSSPSGGTFPFHTSTGVAHYFGVGAYRRPVSDARRSGVRFASECLAFANVGDGDPDPAGTPRDSGAAWDFGDVRDHYVRELFGTNDVGEQFHRAATGEIMAQAFSEWRRGGSACHGALVWFLKDLRPGAGWGLIDSDGGLKACYRYLSRVWKPRTIVLTDEGLDGVHIHVVNDAALPLSGVVSVALLRGAVTVARGEVTCEVAPRSVRTFPADAILHGFHDTAYAYRFGPPGYDVLAASLHGDATAEAFHFPVAALPKSADDATVVAEAVRRGDGQWQLTLHSDRFLYAVHLDVPNFVAGDDYFHLLPGSSRSVVLAGAGPLSGSVHAANRAEPVPIVVTS